MRHRKRGRHLGRTSSHRLAMLRNLASALFLTERDAEFDPNPPKVKGRIITTIQKAKEVRPLVEKCVTIARHALAHQQEAEQFATAAESRHGAVEAVASECASGRTGARPAPRSSRPSVACCSCWATSKR